MLPSRKTNLEKENCKKSPDKDNAFCSLNSFQNRKFCILPFWNYLAFQKKKNVLCYVIGNLTLFNLNWNEKFWFGKESNPSGVLFERTYVFCLPLQVGWNKFWKFQIKWSIWFPLSFQDTSKLQLTLKCTGLIVHLETRDVVVLCIKLINKLPLLFPRRDKFMLWGKCTLLIWFSFKYFMSVIVLDLPLWEQYFYKQWWRLTQQEVRQGK